VEYPENAIPNKTVGRRSGIKLEKSGLTGFTFREVIKHKNVNLDWTKWYCRMRLDWPLLTGLMSLK
jgi:hypothetical protein